MAVCGCAGLRIAVDNFDFICILSRSSRPVARVELRMRVNINFELVRPLVMVTMDNAQCARAERRGEGMPC